MNVYIAPQPEEWPGKGGVQEHLRQLHHHLSECPEVNLLTHPGADVIHAESSYLPPKSPDVYVCHGGFIPNPITSVTRNLASAKVIVSVADWIAIQFFPQFLHKTATIPNGVRLDEWQDLPPSGLEPGFVLYGKEWSYFPGDVVEAAMRLPKTRFVSLIEPKGMAVPDNMEIIGLQDRNVMRSVINDAGCLLLPGPEVCPTMLLEAWACRVPVVAKHGSGNTEIMRPGNRHQSIGGMLYDGIDLLCRAIPGTLSMRDEFGQAGYEEVVKGYQWAELAGLYVRLYEAIIKDEVPNLFTLWDTTRQRQAIARWQACSSRAAGLRTQLA